MFDRRLAAIALLSALAGTANARTQQPIGASAPVSFNKDIAPILAARCVSCHQPGGVGPFNLLTYRDARQRSTLIASGGHTTADAAVETARAAGHVP